MEAKIERAIEMRRKIADPFRTTNGYSWDYCMVFKVIPTDVKLKQPQKDFSMKVILNRMADAGIQTKMFFSVQNDEVWCRTY
jgi:anoctamin-10/anoctamin-7